MSENKEWFGNGQVVSLSTIRKKIQYLLSTLKQRRADASQPLNDLLSAENIVRALAAWSKKYPRERIYTEHVRKEMEGELIELEEAAKLLVYRGR